MQVKHKNISNSETDNWITSSHLVLAYGVWDDNSKFFLIPDRELSVIEPFDKNIEIIDNDLTEYENYPKLNYGKEFYVHKEFLLFAKQFENYHNLKFESIWLKSKLHHFLKNQNFDFPKVYQDTVLNEKYKLGVIEGFLSFTNHFINKESIGSYRNHFYFNKSEKLDAIVPERFQNDEHYKLEELDINFYETELLTFISEKLNYKDINENKWKKHLIRSFFENIDSLFLIKPIAIFRINTFYDDMFVIEYDQKFYYLNYDWSS